MKFSSSSSSSPTTSTTTTTTTSSSAAAISFDDKMCSARSAAPGCLAAMLRRILCFTGLPTHPSDQIKDTEIGFHNLGCLETSPSVAATPGIVGRLMGLESMSGMDLAQTQMNTNSITRSRSMNYDSYRDIESVQGQHRRTKTSLSFHEMPTLLVQDEFFVLSFENLGEFGSKAKTSEMGSGKLRRRKAEKRRSKGESRQSILGADKENRDTNKVVSNEKLNWRIDQQVVNSSKVEDERSFDQISQISTECLNQPKPTTHEEKSNGEKQRTLQKVETECNSENSSPVSVLDFSESIIDPEIPTSEEGSRLAGSNSRRKLSSELENYEHLPPCEPRSSNGDAQSKKMSEGKCRGSRKREWQRQSYAELWSEICEMAEGDLMESNWIYRELWRLQDFKDISVDCGRQILEILLDELVDQLVERPATNCL